MLAASIQRSLERFYQLDISRSPELGKPFYLLNHVDCPAVIVEMGFLSNEEDRAILTNRRGQQKIAEALYRGIAEYFTVM